MVDAAEMVEMGEAPARYGVPELHHSPPDWEVVPLGDVCTLQRGLDLPKDERGDGPYPVVGSNGVVGRHTKFAAEGPGVLVGRSGSVGKVTWITENYWPLNTALWVKDFHGNDPRFVYYLLASIDLSSYAAGVSVPTLNRNLVHPIPVALPPLPEQRAIAHVLSTVQRAKAATEVVIAATHELKRSLTRYFLTYGPVSVDEVGAVRMMDTEAGPLPEDWEAVKLAAISTLIQYGTSVRCTLEPVGVPVLRIPNVLTGEIRVGELKYAEVRFGELEKLRLRPGDLLFVRTNGARDEIGRAALYRGIPEEALFASYLIRAQFDTTLVVPDYAEVIAASDGVRRQIQGHASKAADGKYNINTQTLRSLLVPLAPVDVQRRIVDNVTALESKLRSETVRRGSIDALYQSLLAHLMSGTLRAAASYG